MEKYIRVTILLVIFCLIVFSLTLVNKKKNATSDIINGSEKPIENVTPTDGSDRIENPPDTKTETTTGIANPASVNCIKEGGRSEIRTAEDGSQSGTCIFDDGSECDEWALFRKECAKGSKN